MRYEIALAAMMLVLALMAMMMVSMAEKNNKLEMDLQSAIDRHNRVNHAKNECEDKIINATCLTRNKMLEASIDG